MTNNKKGEFQKWKYSQNQLLLVRLLYMLSFRLLVMIKNYFNFLLELLRNLLKKLMWLLVHDKN